MSIKEMLALAEQELADLKKLAAIAAEIADLKRAPADAQPVNIVQIPDPSVAAPVTAPGPVTPAASPQEQLPCTAKDVGHRSCPCGREGCGNSI